MQRSMTPLRLATQLSWSTLLRSTLVITEGTEGKLQHLRFVLPWHIFKTRRLSELSEGSSIESPMAPLSGRPGVSFLRFYIPCRFGARLIWHSLPDPTWSPFQVSFLSITLIDILGPPLWRNRYACIKAEVKCSIAYHGDKNQDDIPDCPNILSMTTRSYQWPRGLSEATGYEIRRIERLNDSDVAL